MNPIFIIGTERSGTNLLRVILDLHLNIAVPHPPHILKNFFGLEYLYSDLKKDTNFKRLIKDVVKMVELHPYPWGMKIDKNRIFNNVNERNLINIFFLIYGQYLESTGKKRWGCKSTFMINHVALIRHYYPEAQFIYMVRDGRDVAVSAKESIFNHYSVYNTAKLWEKEQRLGIHWLNNMSSDQISLVKYEDLINDPEETIKAICVFLDEPFEKEMLNFFKSDEARKSASISDSWKNTVKPVISSNCGKYRKCLNSNKIRLFESIAVNELEYFSYKIDFFEKEQPKDARFNVAYYIEEWLLLIKVQTRCFFSDKNNLLRYKKYWFIKFVKLKGLIRWGWLKLIVRIF